MSKTAVGLFNRPDVAEQVVHALDAGAFPRDEIRVLGEPRDLPMASVTGTPRTDFEVGLNRELRAIGASDQEANAYVQGVRRGGVLVLATGSDEEVDSAAAIMNRHDALEVEEFIGGEPAFSGLVSKPVARIRHPGGGGARLFAW